MKGAISAGMGAPGHGRNIVVFDKSVSGDAKSVDFHNDAGLVLRKPRP